MCNPKLSIIPLIFIIFVALQAGKAFCIQADSDRDSLKSSIEFSPMSPFINIYAIYYNYMFSNSDELVTGPVYMSIPYEDIGRTNAIGLIIGYRRYIIENFSVEYQLMPMYDHFYEENEDQYYNSFDLWNEFRIGYRFDFNISSLPCYVSIQWPFGFALYSSNKPQSFLDYEEQGDNKFFYKAILLFVGFRF
jgi:hypothetical protein